MEPQQPARSLDSTLHRLVWILAVVTVGLAAVVQRHLGYGLAVVAPTTLILLAPVAAWWAVERRLAPGALRSSR